MAFFSSGLFPKPGWNGTDTKLELFSNQTLMESETVLSADTMGSGPIQTESDVNSEVNLKPTEMLNESEVETTSLATPSFRLDLPEAGELLPSGHHDGVETLAGDEAEKGEEYWVTRPLGDGLMENVDIRTFLEHRPVDEKRITEVVKNITQYFGPSLFTDRPLAESGATSDYMVKDLAGRYKML